MNDKRLAKAIDLVQRAAAAVLELAPLRNDPTTRRLASADGAKHFALTITPDACSIALHAGNESAEVFRFTPGAPATFGSEAA